MQAVSGDARGGTGERRMPERQDWDREADLVVVGSGAAGLAAAIYAAARGLSVVLCEKEGKIGGTTALSNAMIWIPGSDHAVEAGIEDSLDEARRYLQHELGNYYDEPSIEAYLRDGAKAVRALEADSQVRFVLAGTPDYHSSQVGGVDRGRALSPVAFDGRALKSDFELIGDPIRVVLGGMMITSSEVNRFLNPLASLSALGHVLKRVGRYCLDRLAYSRGTELSGGNAFVGAALASLRQRRVELRTRCPMVELVRDGARVAGIACAQEGAPLRIGARRGVVLATGGFAANPELRDELSRSHRHDRTLVAGSASGDGIALARRIGGAVDGNVASPGFWTPVSLLKGKRGGETVVPYGWLDRGRPGVIAVGPDGRRFVNESNSYHDICVGLFENGYPEDRRFFFVCEERFVRKRGMGDILPWPWTPSLAPYLRRGYIARAPTIEALAAQLEIDPQALSETVARHNRHCEAGRDADFGRGDSAFNRTLGDASLGLKNPNLGPIEQGPFIALRIVPATLGTAVGLRTNADAQVLTADGAPIEGLYACGNDATSPMRGVYPGAGITIGPGIVFAYRAVLHAIGSDESAILSRRRSGTS